MTFGVPPSIDAQTRYDDAPETSRHRKSTGEEMPVAPSDGATRMGGWEGQAANAAGTEKPMTAATVRAARNFISLPVRTEIRCESIYGAANVRVVTAITRGTCSRRC
jgi:hypothetical protein